MDKKPFGVKLICVWLTIIFIITFFLAFILIMSKGSLMIPNDKKMQIIQTPQWQRLKVTTIEEFDNHFKRTISQTEPYVSQNFLYSIIEFVFAIGLWKMKKWARIGFIGYSIILMLIGVGLLFSPGIATSKYFFVGTSRRIITFIIVVYYLTRPKVKEQFSR